MKEILCSPRRKRKELLDHLPDSLDRGQGKDQSQLVLTESDAITKNPLCPENYYFNSANPFCKTPNSEQHNTSHHINALWQRKIMRIKQLITRVELSWRLNKFSQLSFNNMSGDQSGEYVWWCRAKGLIRNVFLTLLEHDDVNKYHLLVTQKTDMF